MKHDVTTSVRHSATTSQTVPPPPAESPTDAADRLTEADYLREQAANAAAAIGAAFADFKKSASSGIDPHRLTRKHPWIAVGAAAVAGFAAAAAAVPSKEEQMLRKLAAIEAAAHAAKHPEAEATKAEGKASWIATLGLELLKMLRPILVALVSSAVASATGGPTTEPNHGGSDPSTPSEPPVTG